MELVCLLVYSCREWKVLPFEDGSFITPIWAAFHLENSFNNDTPVYFLTYDEAQKYLNT